MSSTLWNGEILKRPPPSGTPAIGKISSSSELKPHAQAIHKAAEEDYVFGNLCFEISRRQELLDKGLRIRVALWLGKLSRAKTSNAVWHRLRNNYARTLLAQLERGRLAEPFLTRPPEGPLKDLPHWMRGPGSVNNHPATLAESARQVQGKNPFGAKGGATAPASAEPRPMSSREARRLFDEAKALGGGGARPVGTAGRIRLADFDGHRLGARSKAELAAELGASRERNQELDWRLRVAEDRLRDGSLHLSRMVGEEGARRVLSEAGTPSSLDRLIHKYEERRDALRVPGEIQRLSKLYGDSALGGAANKSFGRTSEASTLCDDDGWVRAMQEFRRQTELLRQHISLISP